MRPERCKTCDCNVEKEPASAAGDSGDGVIIRILFFPSLPVNPSFLFPLPTQLTNTEWLARPEAVRPRPRSQARPRRPTLPPSRPPTPHLPTRPPLQPRLQRPPPSPRGPLVAGITQPLSMSTTSITTTTTSTSTTCSTTKASHATDLIEMWAISA